MAKTEAKLETIEEQIKRLQEKKKRLEQKQRTNIGKYVFDKWGIEEESKAMEIIDHLIPNVEEYLKEKYGHGVSKEVSTSQNTNVTNNG